MSMYYDAFMIDAMRIIQEICFCFAAEKVETTSKMDLRLILTILQKPDMTIDLISKAMK
jgi:hypothetical protein